MDNFVLFDEPIHINKFKGRKVKDADSESGYAILDLESEEFSSWTNGLLITIDGTIAGIDRSLIIKYLDDPHVKSVRYGFNDSFEVEVSSVEDFHKYLSYLVSIDEIL